MQSKQKIPGSICLLIIIALGIYAEVANAEPVNPPEPGIIRSAKGVGAPRIETDAGDWVIYTLLGLFGAAAFVCVGFLAYAKGRRPVEEVFEEHISSSEQIAEPSPGSTDVFPLKDGNEANTRKGEEGPLGLMSAQGPRVNNQLFLVKENAASPEPMRVLPPKVENEFGSVMAEGDPSEVAEVRVPNDNKAIPMGNLQTSFSKPIGSPPTIECEGQGNDQGSSSEPEVGNDTPTEEGIRSLKVSAGWKYIFLLIRRADRGKDRPPRRLNLYEAATVYFNFWAFLFGPLYYFFKGMKVEGVALTVFAMISFVPSIILVNKGFPIGAYLYFGVAFFGAISANRAYYRKKTGCEKKPILPGLPGEAAGSEEIEDAEFFNLSWGAHASLSITLLLILLNLVMYGVAGFKDNAAESITLNTLVKMGANLYPLTVSGQWWRLLTACFLHINFGHLIFNMVALLYFGKIGENIYGKRWYLFLYIFSGISGGLVSLFFHRDLICIGASGAILGICGSLFSYGLIQGGSRLGSIWKGYVLSALALVGITILSGLLLKDVDNSAHIGGLIAGMLAGALILLSSSLKPKTPFIRKGALIVLLLVGLWAIGVFVIPPCGEEKHVGFIQFDLYKSIKRGKIKVYHDLGVEDGVAERFISVLKDNGLDKDNEKMFLLLRKGQGYEVRLMTTDGFSFLKIPLVKIVFGSILKNAFAGSEVDLVFCDDRLIAKKVYRYDRFGMEIK